jgi:hypothetical protein
VTLGYAARDVKNGGSDEVSSFRTLLRAQYGVVDRLDVYGGIGLTDVDFEDEDFDGGLGGWFGAGVRYAFLQFPEQEIGIVFDLQGEYFNSDYGSKEAEGMGVQGAVYLVKAVGAAGRMGYFYPYGGVVFSYLEYKMSGGIDDHTGDDPVGVFGGVDYFVNPNVYFYGEVRLFDETSLSAGVGYRF